MKNYGTIKLVIHFSHLLIKKTIQVPIFSVSIDVVHDVIKRMLLANDMVVKTSLPHRSRAMNDVAL